MDWDVIAPMMVGMTLILTVGVVLLLRPLSKRLGDLLELRVKQARGEIDSPKLDRIEQMLESIASRLALAEERLDFTDSLLSRRETTKKELPSSERENWE